jgi:hypothetical protein
MTMSHWATPQVPATRGSAGGWAGAHEADEPSQDQLAAELDDLPVP